MSGHNEQRAREMLAQAFGCDECELSREEVRAAHAVLAWREALTPVKIDSSGLGGGPLYIALDALYDRGWTDLHQKRKCDPRGCKEWVAVLELARSTITPPEGFVLVPVDVTQPMRDAGNRAIRMCNTEPGMRIADRAFYAWRAMLAARPEVP